MEEGNNMAVLIAAIAALLIGGGGILWVVRTSVSAIVKQNAELTDSIGKNTAATHKLNDTMTRWVAVQDERDENRREQLNRIERAVNRRRGDSELH